MLNCRDVARSLASGEQADGGRRPSLAIRLHLLWCRHCRRYASQLALLGRATKKTMQHGPEELELKRRLEKTLLGGDGGSSESQTVRL